MSHSVHPYAHRLGIIRDWKSRWFSSGQKYKDFLKADMMLREYLEKKMRDYESLKETIREVLREFGVPFYPYPQYPTYQWDFTYPSTTGTFKCNG